MIFERLAIAIFVAAFVLATSAAAGCGNYSNEDLEYMNALPQREDLNAKLPSPLVIQNEAEMSKLTHDTTRDFNRVLDFLKSVEVIRSFPPTSRASNSRTWGPVPADQPGWQWRFVVTRDPTMPERFAYVFEMQRLTDAPEDWAPLVTGSFAAENGVRRGVGQFAIETGRLRERAFPFGPDVGFESITVVYDTVAYPIRVEMDIIATNASVHYEYEAQANGQGAMRFHVTGDVVLAWPGDETLTVTSRWLASGAGRADAVVTEGDAVGATRIQCWNESFQQTFNDADWDASMAFGDMADCPAIPVP